ncbi:MAG: hypothetical protein MJ162_05195 [Treponema sp.]|nr:hypothetical protein [Treponema sp.]
MGVSKENVNAAPQYKDRLFRAIFSDPDHKDWLLSLYNAVNNSSYTNVDDLETTTLDDVIYMKMKNDISFIINNQMSLYEHQSTYSPNLPLRGFMYYAELLRTRYHDYKIYSSSRIKIATPNYIVFYNGDRDIGERKVVRLSDSFEVPVKNNDEVYEWTCIMLNINKGRNNKLVESCKALQHYVEYVNMIKENRKAGMNLNNAVEDALDVAVKQKFLNGYFERHRARIKAMSLTEYDEEEAKKVFHDDGYNEGVQAGAAEQKAKDDLIIQKITQEKEAAMSAKDAEIARILEENAKMKALLATKA